MLSELQYINEVAGYADAVSQGQFLGVLRHAGASSVKAVSGRGLSVLPPVDMAGWIDSQARVSHVGNAM